jgi:uncharacterized protein YdeI (YjbR/CyaY-like superfamily)
MTNDDLPAKRFASAQKFDAWLARNHDRAQGVWLEIAKKDAPKPTLTYAEAIDVALCYGWIDGQKRPLDDAHWRQRFTPRSAKSKWSKINRDKATALMEQGRMQPAGRREVERAQADGRWDAAYDSSSTATVPDDLAAALAENPDAAKFFAALDRTNRYAILYRIHDAKRPDTRARRIAQYVAMLARGEKLH